MSFLLEIKDKNVSVEIESNIFVDSRNPRWLQLLNDLSTQHTETPINKFEVSKVGSEYLYKITLADGRVWTHIIQPSTQIVVAKFTFDVPDFWGISEFFPFDSIRLHTLSMLVDFDIIKLEYIFL